MIAQRAKTLILWLPTLALLIATFIIILTLVVDSRQRIADLENHQNPVVITFTFNQPQGRFRIVCNADSSTPNIYSCRTIRIGGPSPSPSNSPGG